MNTGIKRKAIEENKKQAKQSGNKLTQNIDSCYSPQLKNSDIFRLSFIEQQYTFYILDFMLLYKVGKSHLRRLSENALPPNLYIILKKYLWNISYMPICHVKCSAYLTGDSLLAKTSMYGCVNQLLRSALFTLSWVWGINSRSKEKWYDQKKCERNPGRAT